MCIYRVFHWNVLVQYHRQISIQLHNHINFMQYFTLYIWQQQTGCCHYYCTHQTIDFIAQEQKLLTTTLITIWENTDGCAEQYKCASTLYLFSVMSQCYSIIIYRDISAPGHGKEVVDRLNAVDKRYIYQLMSKFQPPGSVRLDSQIKIHTGTKNKYVSLAK